MPRRARPAPTATPTVGTWVSRTQARRLDPTGSPTRLRLTTGAVTHRNAQLYNVCPPICGTTAKAANRRSSRGVSPKGARLDPNASAYTKRTDRKSVVEGKSVDLGGRRIIKKKKER